LLALHPTIDTNDEVSCTLTVHDLDEAIPKFTALSYTWGSKSGAKTILVNRIRTSITRNLHAALTQLRSTERLLVFWIDALCINQNDQHERSRQVALMRDIYMVADDVVAFLGPVTPSLDPDDKARAFLDISRRPYWDRLWIIQEFVLGKKESRCSAYLISRKGITLKDMASISLKQSNSPLTLRRVIRATRFTE
jgi:hypothetical protein